MTHVIDLDMYQSAGVGVLALLLGFLFTRHIPFLKRFCIPAPVSGGLVVSLLTLLLYALGVECVFNGTVKDLCMMVFFTAVGFQCDLKMLRQGGKPLLVMIFLVAVLIVTQNLLSVGIAKGMGLSPLLGMAAGSIPMSGGHGTSGGFAPLLEEMGLSGAGSITMAAATFGLVAGSLLGGPLGERLIRRWKLAEESRSNDVLTGIEASEASDQSRSEYAHSEESSFRGYTMAVCQLFLAMALGACVSALLKRTGITFPTYFGSLIAAALLRNVLGAVPKWSGFLDLGKITSLGDISLSLFLGMAMSTLRLWELASMALPLSVILVSQVVLMALYAAFVAFPLLGKDYDGAVLVSGLCGFGLGATPNAMANMSAVCFKYRHAVRPFVIVPIIGAMFVDLINTAVVTLFLNLL
jgi:ESS family glutamate:Na+ symporter